MADRTLPPVYSLATALDLIPTDSQRGSASLPTMPSQRQAANPAIAEMLTKHALLLKVNLSDPQEELILRTLIEKASANLDAQACSFALSAWELKSGFMPRINDLLAEAKPFLDDQRLSRRLERERLEQAEARALPTPSFFNPKAAENKAALDAMNAAFDAADAKDKPLHKPKVDYADPDTAPRPPAVSDASEGLKARARALRGE